MDMKRPLLFAHRGFSGEYPENRPLAFQMAVEKTRADGIESDVHISKDGKLVICDYKTDKLSAEEKHDRALLLKNMREKHGEQLKQYEYAIKRIFGQSPKKIFIYLMSLGEAIEIY